MTDSQTPSRLTDLQKAFAATDKTGDLRRQLALAEPVALDRLWNRGVDPGDMLDDVERLAGANAVFHRTDDRELWFEYCRHVSAAFALGITLGQLVDRQIFAEKGSQR